MQQKPSVGRIVHFVGEAPGHLAAIVTKVWSPTMVNLQVFGTEFTDPPVTARTSVECDESATRTYAWHWPEREE